MRVQFLESNISHKLNRWQWLWWRIYQTSSISSASKAPFRRRPPKNSLRMCLWKLPGVITIIICYPEILFLPVKSEILLKPSQELGSSARQTLSVSNSTTGTTVSTTAATSTSDIAIITSTTTTTQSTTGAASLLDDSDEASRDSEKAETTDVLSGDESVETSIILKSSDIQTSNRVYCKGAFFCRYQTIPYTSAKIRVFSNIARVDEK